MSATVIKKQYHRVLARAAELADLQSAEGLLGWDQETKMPKKGVEGRSHVSATLAGVIHEKLTESALGDDLNSLVNTMTELDDMESAQIREFQRVHKREARLPRDLVRSVAETQSRAAAVWANAREENDFNAFSPLLEEMVRLKREVAEAVGYDDDPYDALLDEYEPGAKGAETEKILNDVREFLIPLVQQIAEAGPPPETRLIDGPFDTEEQDAFGRKVVAAMGFDLEAGRLDLSPHPFTSGIHQGDIRLTTRYKQNLTVGLFGTMHEAGHGLYEQNIPADLRRSPLGVSTSLGIHESQSRLWENIVGRGRAFWKHFFPILQQHFPDQLGTAHPEEFYRAVNEVRPSFIRIEADEVTYNLHIVIRFEIERELVSGRLKVADLPEAWNTKFTDCFGITPPSPALGVLQDIHWAMGLIGYFPTYTLGNLYASQLYAAAGRDLPTLDAEIESGNLIPLRDWLVENVHRWGRRYDAAELAERTTGERLNVDHFKNYILEKYGPIYGIG